MIQDQNLIQEFEFCQKIYRNSVKRIKSARIRYKIKNEDELLNQKSFSLTPDAILIKTRIQKHGKVKPPIVDTNERIFESNLIGHGMKNISYLRFCGKTPNKSERPKMNLKREKSFETKEKEILKEIMKMDNSLPPKMVQSTQEKNLKRIQNTPKHIIRQEIEFLDLTKPLSNCQIGNRNICNENIKMTKDLKNRWTLRKKENLRNEQRRIDEKRKDGKPFLEVISLSKNKNTPSDMQVLEKRKSPRKLILGRIRCRVMRKCIERGSLNNAIKISNMKIKSCENHSFDKKITIQKATEEFDSKSFDGDSEFSFYSNLAAPACSLILSSPK